MTTHPSQKKAYVFFTSHVYSHYNISDKKDFTNTKTFLELYQTGDLHFPVTLGIKGGINSSTGDVPFYKLNTLGRLSGLRGYARDRFAGQTAAYFNSQLSVEFGTLNTTLAPLTFGLYNFYDCGRIWIPGESSDKIHAGYGVGIYFTPLFEILTTRISMAFSDEEPKGIFEIGLGTNF